MTIHLPNDLESRIQAAVQNGRIASVDDAMAEAARLLPREIDQRQQEPHAGGIDLGPDPFLGSMRDADDELDQIVADAYRRRREDTWRDVAVE
jgi:Arc/MetJ-type ribon-helix-helix transcriptional regulator